MMIRADGGALQPGGQGHQHPGAHARQRHVDPDGADALQLRLRLPAHLPATAEHAQIAHVLQPLLRPVRRGQTHRRHLVLRVALTDGREVRLRQGHGLRLPDQSAQGQHLLRHAKRTGPLPGAVPVDAPEQPVPQQGVGLRVVMANGPGIHLYLRQRVPHRPKARVLRVRGNGDGGGMGQQQHGGAGAHAQPLRGADGAADVVHPLSAGQQQPCVHHNRAHGPQIVPQQAVMHQREQARGDRRQTHAGRHQIHRAVQQRAEEVHHHRHRQHQRHQHHAQPEHPICRMLHEKIACLSCGTHSAAISRWCGRSAPG